MRLHIWLASAIAISFGYSTAHADSYPSKPILVIVDAAPGGTVDIWARRLARYLPDTLQQPVVVENRPGASSTIAIEAVVAAVPDG
jgi:tripartite-type tricarboxylate transporter receptor subunit TctC